MQTVQPLRLLVIVLVLGISVVGIARADWVAPTAAPPQGNAPPPIHSGSSVQNKEGDLFLDNGLTVANGLLLSGGSFGVGNPLKLILDPTNLSPATGRILTSLDATGSASWTDPAMIKFTGLRLHKTVGVPGSTELFTAVGVGGDDSDQTGTALCQTSSPQSLCLAYWDSAGTQKNCNNPVSGGRALCAGFGD